MQKLSIHNKLPVVFLVASFFICQNILAAGIGVKPKEINQELKIGKEGGVEILIKNTGDEPAIYKIFSDREGINIYPSEFKLEAGEERIAQIGYRFWLPRSIKGGIKIIARPLNSSGVTAVPAIEIPLLLNLKMSLVGWIILIFSISVCMLILRKKGIFNLWK